MPSLCGESSKESGSPLWGPRNAADQTEEGGRQQTGQRRQPTQSRAGFDAARAECHSWHVGSERRGEQSREQSRAERGEKGWHVDARFWGTHRASFDPVARRTVDHEASVGVLRRRAAVHHLLKTPKGETPMPNEFLRHVQKRLHSYSETPPSHPRGSDNGTQ